MSDPTPALLSRRAASLLLGLVAPSSRRALAILFALMCLSSLAESLGVGAIAAFVTMLTRPLDELGVPGALLPILEPLYRLPDSTRVLTLSGIVLGVYLLKNALLVGVARFKFVFLYDQYRWASERIARAALTTPYAVHASRSSIDVTRVVAEDARRSYTHVLAPLFEVFVEALVALALMSALLLAAPLPTLAAAASLVAVVTLYYSTIRRRLVALGATHVSELSTLMRNVSEAMGSLKETRVAGRERYFLDRVVRANDAYAHSMTFHDVARSVPKYFTEFIGVIGMLVIVVALGLDSDSILDALPVLSLYALSVFRLMPSANRIAVGLTKARHAFHSVVELDALSHALDDASLDPPADPLPFEATIDVQDAVFRYAPDSAPVLDGLSLTIARGESVALVGTSGAGKTTLVDVMLGLHTLESGRVLVDGADIRGDERRWHANVAYITQPITMVDDTIRQNVSFSTDERPCDEERVWRALEDARLADHVRALPDGLDTLVGEDGARISGGQRQRIALARALYVEADVLVFDEATSALDNETERDVIRTLESVSADRTLIMIAHRLSTVRRCDRVILLANGKVLDHGPFDELYARQPTFAALVDASEQ